MVEEEVKNAIFGNVGTIISYRIGVDDAEIIAKKIDSLKINPFRFLKRLHGEKLWRLRIMDYRAIVDVIVSMNKIIVVRIGHRKNVYDN